MHGFHSSSFSSDRKWIYRHVVAHKTLDCTLPAEPVTRTDIPPPQPLLLLSLAELYDGNWYKHCDRVSG